MANGNLAQEILVLLSILGDIMNYRVFPPGEVLAECVKCFWTLEDEATEEPARQRIMPDGCMEMIFHYGDLYRQYLPDNTCILQPRAFVYGQITTVLEIAPTGKTGIISARFHPDGLLPILNKPVTQLEDRAVPLQELFGEEGELLTGRVIGADNNVARMAIIEQFLLSKMSFPDADDRITKSCVDMIMKSQGRLSVDELSDAAQLNRRNKERRFHTAIGMSPKQLSKAVRLQTALRLLDQNQYSSLTALAYESGYYDQAHFIKDFREFTGFSPKMFYSNHLQFAKLFASAE